MIFDVTVSCVRKASLRKHCPPKLRTIFNRSFSLMNVGMQNSILRLSKVHERIEKAKSNYN